MEIPCVHDILATHIAGVGKWNEQKKAKLEIRKILVNYMNNFHFTRYKMSRSIDRNVDENKQKRNRAEERKKKMG